MGEARTDFQHEILKLQHNIIFVKYAQSICKKDSVKMRNCSAYIRTRQLVIDINRNAYSYTLLPCMCE